MDVGKYPGSGTDDWSILCDLDHAEKFGTRNQRLWLDM